MSKNARILVIPDMHMPYCHPDTWGFLRGLKKKYKPDCVVCLGDEIDGHALSFHESDPDLDSAGPELEKAIALLQPIFKLFPKVFVLESNHGSLVYRKAKSAGIPRRALKTYRDTLSAPKGWVWSFDLRLRMSNGEWLYAHHGKTGKQGALSQKESVSSVQGHFHSKFHATYWRNSQGLYFDIHAGCLVDHDSLAFAYGKNTMEKGIVGAWMILDGNPKPIPMLQDKRGRWTGALP
jgi:hypothetical protein